LPRELVVVFDTNVIIPMSIEASLSTRLFLRLVAAGHKVMTSRALLRETAEKMRTNKQLRKWLALSDEKIARFLRRLPVLCPPTTGKKRIRGAVKADPKDDKVLAAAVNSSASYIISEDRHLLDLGIWRGIKIMTRAEFMSELDRLGVP
jgi:putative PIN family toxin of toxin-antitoxin system